NRELLQGKVEEHAIVLEEVKPVPGNLGSALEVDQVKRLAELDVIPGREVKGSRGAYLADLPALFLGDARGGIGMGQVGHASKSGLELGFERPQSVVAFSDFRLQALALSNQ